MNEGTRKSTLGTVRCSFVRSFASGGETRERSREREVKREREEREEKRREIGIGRDTLESREIVVRL